MKISQKLRNLPNIYKSLKQHNISLNFSLFYYFTILYCTSTTSTLHQLVLSPFCLLVPPGSGSTLFLEESVFPSEISIGQASFLLPRSKLKVKQDLGVLSKPQQNPSPIRVGMSWSVTIVKLVNDYKCPHLPSSSLPDVFCSNCRNIHCRMSALRI